MPIDFDDLKTTFNKQQQERERYFTAAADRAQRMLANFPAGLLPSAGHVTAECDVFVEWHNTPDQGTILFGTFTDEKAHLNSGLRGYPDPKDPTTSVELLAEVKAAFAYDEPCETCGRCGQPWPKSE